MKLTSLLGACLLLAITSLNAQEKKDVNELDEIVVTATKFPMKKEQIGKVIYQIKPEEIEHFKGKSLIDVLDNLAGIQINGVNSSPGKNKSTYIRGGRDRQVLVLIDGIPVSDPSGINTMYDLRFISLPQVESIEVMNGSASTLYGSGAATGVINIKLKQAVNNPISLNYQASLGTNNTQKDSNFNLTEIKQNAALSGTLNRFSYLASVNVEKTSGLSEAQSEINSDNFENDAFKAVNTFVRFKYQFSNNFNIQIFNNYDKDTYDFDAGAFTDSEINNGKNKQFRVGLSSNFNYKKGELSFTASKNKINRVYDIFNSWTSNTDNFDYTGKTTQVELVNNYKFSTDLQLVTGINYIEQSNQTNSAYGNLNDDLAKFNTIDPYFTLFYNSEKGFNINGGARLNNHSEYGNHWVYNVNPSYILSGNFRLISSYSTAFIAPSTYQLFSQYGNTDLKPEEDKSIEAGFVYSLKKVLEFNAVFFYREEKNAIILPDFVTYQNAAEIINAKGLETNINWRINENVSLRVGHAFTSKSADLDYIPKNKFTAQLDYAQIKNTFLSLRFKNISNRNYFDEWGTGKNIELSAYSLLDFYASHTFSNNNVTLFLQVNNIFNKNYVETIGYTTKGSNFKIGLDFKF